MPRPDVLVLAGGRARRMGGQDKLALPLAGVTVLDRVLLAAAEVGDRIVVVGPLRPTVVERVEFTLEPEPGGGPVPAVQAGLARLPDAAVVLVLAGDLPMVGAADLRRLVAGGADAVAAADDAGRPNPLLAAYRGPVLRQVAAVLEPGDPAARLLPPDCHVVDLGPVATLNVNRPADLERARSLLLSPGRPLG